MGEKTAALMSRYGLALACVLLPIALGVFGNQQLAGWLGHGSELCAITRALPIKLIGEGAASPLRLSAKDAETCDKAIAARLAEAAPVAQPPAKAADATPSRAGSAGPAQAEPPAAEKKSDNATTKAEEKPSPGLQLVANHIAGRLNVAYAYAFLLLVSVVAFCFGSYVVIDAKGIGVWLAAVIFFATVTAFIAYHDINTGGVRAIVADNILARADADALLQYLPVADNLRTLIMGGLTVGYLSVGLVLCALFFATIRNGKQSTLADLKRRLVTIRIGLVLGSAILVVVVLSSRAVFDWPLSLLVDADRKVLMPAADALVRKWGAIGSISLIGAFLPAITAWYLDRDAYRNAPDRVKEPPAPKPDDGELEIAPMSTVTSIVVVLAPVIASPIFDALKSVLAAVNK